MIFNIFEVYVGILAVVFTGAGILIALRLSRPKVEGTESIKDLALTPRESDVLQLLIQGLSNAEIADKLFLSLSTVKTHVSTLFVKMEVKSRTQAMEKVNRLKIEVRGKPSHTLV